jgi:hypothetical protein
MNINPKVTAAVLAAAVTTVIAWLLTLAGIQLPNEVQGAITSILVFTAGYMTPGASAAAVGNLTVSGPLTLSGNPVSGPSHLAISDAGDITITNSGKHVAAPDTPANTRDHEA